MLKFCTMPLMALMATIALSSASYAIQDHPTRFLDRDDGNVGHGGNCRWYLATLLDSQSADPAAGHTVAHAPGLVEQDFSQSNIKSNIDRISRYFGAGLVLQDSSGWSLTIESGAYFSDSRSDRALLLHPDHRYQDILLDDLDSADRAAVGERHARSIQPVSHLVIRRRF